MEEFTNELEELINNTPTYIVVSNLCNIDLDTAVDLYNKLKEYKNS